MRRLDSITNLAAVLVALAACGRSDAQTRQDLPRIEQPGPAPSQVPPSPPPPASAPTTALPTAELKLASVGNTMTYDTTTLTVRAGQSVHLVLTSHSNIEAMPHNWVLGTPSADPATIATAGLGVGPGAAYVDPRDRNVLAHTPLAMPGKTVETTFTAPATPGTYPFFCTCPGHYLTMKGKLEVTS